MSTQIDPFLDLGFEESPTDSLDAFTQLGFIEEAPIEEQEPSFIQKLAKAPQAVRSAIQTGREAIKGVIKKGGVGAAEALLGTYGDIIEGIRPSEAPSPIIRFPTSPEVQNLMQMLGIETEPQNVVERFAKRAGEAAGTGLAFGGAAIPALMTGAIAGQGAREFGAPEWLSSLIDIGATFGKGAIKQKLLPRGKEAQKLVAAGRKLGLTEKEITPLVKGPKMFAVGKAFTRKAAKMERVQKNIKKKLGDSYQFVKKEAATKGTLSIKDSEQIIGNLKTHLKELSKTHAPSDAKAKAMDILTNIIKDMEGMPVPKELAKAAGIKGLAKPLQVGKAKSTYEKLINTYQDINQELPKVRNFLEPVKKAFTEVIKSKSPELAQDFENVNQLYSNFSQRLAKIKPNLLDQFMDKAGVWGIPAGLVAAAMGKPWSLVGVLTTETMRSLGQGFLTEPWLQNLPNKFLHALKVNDKEGAIKLIASFKKLVKKKYDKDLDEEEDYSAE